MVFLRGHGVGTALPLAYLEKVRQTEPFDPSLYDEDVDPEEMEMDWRNDIRRSACDLLLVERAKEYLLDNGNG